MKREGILLKSLNSIDAFLKFPNLRKGEIGIQIGFDLSSKNLTTDVIKMTKRTTRSGKVIAIDPDPLNHSYLNEIIQKKSLNVECVPKGTFFEKTDEKLTLGVRSSYNVVSKLKAFNSPSYTDKTIEVELDTLDNIIQDLGITDYSKIRHINITNNGAEYQTLLGIPIHPP